jgi:fumigallin biosynthesis monooxygenase-like protein
VADLKPFVMIDGANQFSGVRALWWVVRRWPKLRKEMTGARGYLAHRVWYAFPLTLGITSWWQDENAAYRFAHLPVHRDFWGWAASGEKTKGGWLATYQYVKGGPLWGNGVAVMMQRLGKVVPAANNEPPRPPPGV